MTIHFAPCARAALATALCLAVAGSPAVVLAQSTSLTPVSGSKRLDAGFLPDPHSIAVRAGGPVDVDAAGLPADCDGYITAAATYEVYYKAGSSPLIFRTESDEDTTLLINGPDSAWTCDDDSGSGVNAEVVFDSPATGTYDVWVGKLYGGTAPATLSVSEVRSSSDDEDWDDEDWDEEETQALADYIRQSSATTVDLEVCNRSGYNAVVAVMYVPEGQTGFVTEGWFPISAGQCAPTVSSPNKILYAFAQVSGDASLVWEGGHGGCVQYPGPFKFVNTSSSTCESYQVYKGFRPLDPSSFGKVTYTLQ